jgi:hypothetical protein
MEEGVGLYALHSKSLPTALSQCEQIIAKELRWTLPVSNQICVAFQAFRPVNANHGTTGGTCPSRGFVCQKTVHVLPDHVEVFNGTGSVFGAVAFVELFQPPAWK